MITLMARSFAPTKSSLQTRMVSRKAASGCVRVGKGLCSGGLRVGRRDVFVCASSRCDGFTVSGDSADAQALLLQRLGSRDSFHSHQESNVLCVVAAKPTTPPVAPHSFATFGRTYWPFLLFFQTAALIGAAVSGISSRKKRVELAELNSKLRELMQKDEETQCVFDWDNLEGQCTDAWPGAFFIEEGSELLKGKKIGGAMEAFMNAQTAVESEWGEKNEGKKFSISRLDGVAAAAYLAATKGLAACLSEDGSDAKLRESVTMLKTVEALAHRAKDETFYGTVADTLADLGDFAQAGVYYDKVLEMDEAE